LNENQTQELLHHPQLTSILMSELLKNDNQDSSSKIRSEISEDISAKRNQDINKTKSLEINEDNEVTNILGLRNQSENQSQTQELRQMVLEISQKLNELSQGQKSIVHEVGSAKKAIIHATQQQKDHEYPSYYLLLPLIKEQSTISTSKFQKMFQKVKEKAENLIFDKSQLHCFCEFKVRSPKNGQLQPLFHPTNSPGKIPFYFYFPFK